MAMRKIFVTNPGSTSTKVALFEEERIVFSKTIEHSAEELAPFKEIVDQLEFRAQKILDEVQAAGHSLDGCAAFVGRGGSSYKITGGTYEANDIMLEHLRVGITGYHPLAWECCCPTGLPRPMAAGVYGEQPLHRRIPGCTRITGFKDIYRDSFVHALNQKEVAIRYAASKNKSTTK